MYQNVLNPADTNFLSDYIFILFLLKTILLQNNNCELNIRDDNSSILLQRIFNLETLSSANHR